MSTPFIVHGLPRSRTFWLSHFLSFGDYQCRHEQAQHLRSMDDIRSWLSMDWTGSAETAVMPAWRIIRHYRPDIKTLVVRRPVEEVVDSLMNLDFSGICYYERDTVIKGMTYLDRYLDQIEDEMPNTLSVRFADLATEETCKRVFEHCLPYTFDPKWWRIFEPMKLVINSRALMRYRFAHRAQIDALKAECWRELRRLARLGEARKAA